MNVIEKKQAFQKLDDWSLVYAILTICEIKNENNDDYLGLTEKQMAKQIEKYCTDLTGVECTERAKQSLEFVKTYSILKINCDVGRVICYRLESENIEYGKSILKNIGFLESNETLTLPN